MALPATDDFNRADSVDIGTNWTTCTSDAGVLQIVTNRVRRNTDDDSSEVWNADVWPQDHYSEINLFSTGASGLGAGYGPTCRASTSAKTYYRLIGNGSGYELMKFVAASGSSLASSSGTTFADGDTMRLSATGSSPTTLKMYKNGVQFGSDIVDSSSPITTGGAGIAYSSTDVPSNIDSWIGDAIAGGATGISTAWIIA